MDLKTWCKRLLFPPIWIVVIGTFVSTIGLVTVFVKGWQSNILAIIVYVFSFYSLVILCAVCITRLPKKYKRIKRKVYENKYANRYFSDKMFKNHVNLYRSLIINMIYALVNVISAIIYKANWFGIFAVYYGIMAFMRFLLARYARKNPIGENRFKELKRSRLCAYILLTVNLTLSGVVLMMVYFHRGFQYQGFLIYVMALYTFYITTTAIIDMVKYRKYKSPVMSMSVLIKLTSALFSMLFLETAMFASFGQNTPEATKRIMIMATGAGISVIVFVLAIYMIRNWTKEIRKIRSER